MSNPFSNHNDQSSQDFPPESFWVPQDEAVDWFNQNAYMDRKGSMKLTLFGTTNFNLKNEFYEFQSSPPSTRLTLIPKTKSSILALPRRSFLGDRILGHRLRPEKGRLFRSRSESEIRPVGSEPGSPRVSCMGKVGRAKKGCRAKRKGLWASVRAILKTRFRANRIVSSKGIPESSEVEFGPAGLGGSKRFEFYKNI